MCFSIRPGRDAVSERVSIPSVYLEERDVKALFQIHGLKASDGDRLTAAYPLDQPLAERKSCSGEKVKILSNGPQMWLLQIETDERRESLQSLRETLAPIGATATDLSSARAMIRVSGRSARYFLKKGAPIDIDALENLDVAVTMIGHIGSTIHCCGDSFDLYVPRSYSEDFWQWCRINAREFN